MLTGTASLALKLLGRYVNIVNNVRQTRKPIANGYVNERLVLEIILPSKETDVTNQ